MSCDAAYSFTFGKKQKAGGCEHYFTVKPHTYLTSNK